MKFQRIDPSRRYQARPKNKQVVYQVKLHIGR